MLNGGLLLVFMGGEKVYLSCGFKLEPITIYHLWFVMNMICFVNYAAGFEKVAIGTAKPSTWCVMGQDWNAGHLLGLANVFSWSMVGWNMCISCAHVLGR